MAIPAIGDGEYLGAGNTNETLRVGRSTQAVVIGDSGAAPVTIGGAAASKVGFYGATPVVQRPYTASLHATSAIVSSADFAAGQTAIVAEIMKTLVGLGIYATA